MHLLFLIPQMFDMSSDSPLASHRSPDSCSFTTLLYNQYKPGVMAVGCSNHSILLFSTANRNFADLFLSPVCRQPNHTTFPHRDRIRNSGHFLESPKSE